LNIAYGSVLVNENLKFTWWKPWTAHWIARNLWNHKQIAAHCRIRHVAFEVVM